MDSTVCDVSSVNNDAPVSQYYALQILETVIKTRWKILPRNQCEGQSEPPPPNPPLSEKDLFLNPLSSAGIKKYVVGLIIKTSSDPANMEVMWQERRPVCLSTPVPNPSSLPPTEGGRLYFQAQHDPGAGKGAASWAVAAC